MSTLITMRTPNPALKAVCRVIHAGNMAMRSVILEMVLTDFAKDNGLDVMDVDYSMQRMRGGN